MRDAAALLEQHISSDPSVQDGRGRVIAWLRQEADIDHLNSITTSRHRAEAIWRSVYHRAPTPDELDLVTRVLHDFIQRGLKRGY
jgi:hypothetical protein